MAKKKSSFLKKFIISLVFVFSAIMLGGSYFAYKAIYRPNVNLGGKKSEIIYIPTGSTFEDVMHILVENGILKNKASFEWLAERKNYKKNIKPGKYRILAKMGNNSLINLLKGGIQEPVEINFTGIRTKQQLISRLSKRIEADSADLHHAFNDNSYLSKYGFNSKNILALFIPNTYEFYWNTSVDDFFEKMYSEYQKVWTQERMQKATSMGLSPVQATILASIVQGEQCCDYEEKRKIAGLYLNRLRKGMLLQSDPTVIYGIGNFNIQRLSFEQLRYDSPYNTYKYKGLPPGPIGFVKISSIDAVVNFESNDYIYMCAKEDFSGMHYFSNSFRQHCEYADKYRKALNKKNIRGSR
jgi:UPF0755 protein